MTKRKPHPDYIPGDDEQMSGSEAICPHCGYPHGDTWELCPEESDVEVICDECHKPFLARTEYTSTVHTSKPPQVKP